MKGYLLDTNLLIALLWPSHERHELALKWFNRHRAKGWATCPITQTGFVRIVSNPAFSRDAVQPREAIHKLIPTKYRNLTSSAFREFTLANPSNARCSPAMLKPIGSQE
jgi:predicted nucleic acid-binding protein